MSRFSSIFYIFRQQPDGPRHRQNLRKNDPPGCGPPICTIIDRKVKTFLSMCHFVEYMNLHGRYRTLFEVQKGSCEESSKKNCIESS